MICSIEAPLGLCSLITFRKNGGKGTISDQARNSEKFFINHIVKGIDKWYPIKFLVLPIIWSIGNPK
ncbi:Uncharacterised protein [Mycobacteroides abscessus subsp. abscessus]|nr:Uncharacterised protein [Mycobacteroides abscessus subsp. abscessus]